MFPKAIRVEDPAYLAWARLEACFSCGLQPAGQAHHVIAKGMGRATVRDDYAVPACERCHARCHGRIVDGQIPIAKEFQIEAAQIARARFLASLDPSNGSVPF